MSEPGEEANIAASEQQRHGLYAAFSESHGEEVAVNLLEALPPAGLPDLATKDDIALLRRDLQALDDKTALRFEQVDRRFEQVDRRFDDFQTQIDRRFDQIDRRFDGFQAQIDRRFDAQKTSFDTKLNDLEARLDAKLQAELRRQTARLAAGATTLAVVVTAVLRLG